jgi:Phosphate-selective porin O and P
MRSGHTVPEQKVRRSGVASGIGALTAVLLALGFAAEGRAGVTLIEGDKGELDMEIRLMAWAVDSGPELIPGNNSTPPPAQEENINDFFVRRARLILHGQISKSLEIQLQMGQDNIGSQTLKDDAGFRIKDAYINFKHVDSLQLTVGQFKVPFLRQNLESGFNQLLVDRSMVTGLRPSIEGSRDQGGMIWGGHAGLQYRAAVFDGSDQEDTSTRSSLRGSARVSWNWFTPEPGLGFTGTTFGQKRILQVGLQGDAQNGRLDARDDDAFVDEARDYRNRAVDVYYDQPFSDGAWALTVEGAWLQRRDDYGTDGLATRTIDGSYVQTGFLIPGHIGPGRVQLVGRYERIDNDRGGVSSDLHARTFGFTWFTKGHDRKIQFDHIDSVERPTDLDDNIYRLSFVAVF